MKKQLLGIAANLTLLLLLSQCVDHELDQLRVKTLPIGGNLLKLEVLSLGSEPVTEWGLLYFAYSQSQELPQNVIPVYGSSTRAIFNYTITVGVHTLAIREDFFRNFNIYYRAYAKQSDGTIAYGDVMLYKWP